MQIDAGEGASSVSTAPRDAVSARMQRRAETALFWSVLIAVALMTLPIAGARQWSSSLGAVAIGLSAFAYALCVIFAGSRIEVPMRKLWAPGVLIALPVAWALVQTFPIAQSALTHPLWISSNEVLHRSVSGRISIDPHATGTALMRLLLHVAVFYLAVQLCRSSERAFFALAGIVAIGTADALYRPLLAQLGALADPPASAWAGETADPLFVGLSLLAAIALLAKLVHGPAVRSPDWRTLGSALLRIARSSAWAPAIAVFILLGIALGTHSGSELMAAALGVATLLIALISASKAGRIGYRITVALALVSAMTVIGLAGLLVLGGRESGRPVAGPASEIRSPIEEALAAAPLLGHGYGTFDVAFPIYADEPHDGGADWEPNVYLKLAFELGLPAAAMLILAIAWVALRCAIGLYTRRRDIVYPALGVAAAIAAGSYALVGSGPAPSVAALLALILGMGYSQSWASSEALRITRSRDLGGNGMRPADQRSTGAAPG
ncbi:MAG TPA: O-antigen ligase family protein [Methyloceanibacter sp.]|nr:O-antigen ligase family protein [Methyloceanibacter sp.]